MRRRRTTVALALTLALGALLPGQAKPNEFRDPGMRFTIVLPEGWRRQTPDEARALRPSMPADVADLINPGILDRFGRIDDWREKGFDGICLSISREEGEPAMDESTLERCRAALERSNPRGLKFSSESLVLAKIGADQLPVVEWRLRIDDRDGKGIARELRYLVPTGGVTLRLAFRSDLSGFAAAETEFRSTIATLAVTRPAEGRKELSDKLKMPLIIGSLVGLVLLALYALNKR